MAEIISNNKSKGRKRLSTRIDLTPMVDLGFLLITFFIFTTTMMKPSTMEVFMPDDTPTPHPTEIPHHCAMKIFIGENHKLFYLTGLDAMKNNFSAMKEVNVTDNKNIRRALLTHVESIKEAFRNHLEGSKADDKPFILVKATSKSNYGDLVDLLDELTISGIKDYALLDIENEEESAVVARL